MATQLAPRRLPNLKFRVLVIGRANSGKTSILQRVCDTTRSPTIYRRSGYKKEQIQLDPSTERGEHSIEDELIFSNHDGYIFHDSRGFESGGDKELEIVQKFVREKSGEKRLADRLHAIWYCIPMDYQRPGLDLKHFKDVCPDRNVPIIAVFTKFDEFKLNVEMELEDHGDPDGRGTAAPEIRFREHYLCHLGDGARFVQLERMHKLDGCCKSLIEETAGALGADVVTLMLLAVQRSNVELSVKLAMTRVHPHFEDEAKGVAKIVKMCLFPFPYVWYYFLFDDFDFDEFDDDFFDIFEDEDDLGSTSSTFQDNDDEEDDDFDDFIKHIMSMPVIKNLSATSNNNFFLIIAIITLLKHATLLLPSGFSSKSALVQADLDYQQFDIHSKAALYFTAPLQQYSVHQLVDFIMSPLVSFHLVFNSV